MRHLKGLHKLRRFEFPLIIGVFFVDQGTKFLAVKNLPWRHPVDFIPGFISFIYTKNTGAAFNFFTDQRWFLVLTSSSVLAAMVYFYRQLIEDYRMSRLSWSLIFAGALGNLCDRIVTGSVVDFLAFDFVSFPVFNVADMAITCGGALYIISTLRFEWMQRRNHERA